MYIYIYICIHINKTEVSLGALLVAPMAAPEPESPSAPGLDYDILCYVMLYSLLYHGINQFVYYIIIMSRTNLYIMIYYIRFAAGSPAEVWSNTKRAWVQCTVKSVSQEGVI